MWKFPIMLYAVFTIRLKKVIKRKASPHKALPGGISTSFHRFEKFSTGKQEAVNNFFSTLKTKGISRTGIVTFQPITLRVSK